MGTRLTAILGACLIPLVAAAADDEPKTSDNSSSTSSAAGTSPATDDSSTTNNEAYVGSRYQSGTSPMAGRYTGQERQGLDIFGGFSVRSRDKWDSGGTFYYNAQGDNINLQPGQVLPDTSAEFNVGHQGQWGVGLSYRSNTWNQSDSFHTIYNSSGGLQGGAATGGANQFHSSTLAQYLTTDRTGVRRDDVALNGNYRLNESWTVTGGIFHDHKEGMLEQSMLFGTGKNATPQAPAGASNQANLVYFPQPIDYDTDRFNVNLGYTLPTQQLQLSYTFSHFTDNNTYIGLADPFATAGTNGNNLVNGGSASKINGAYSLPPSNMSHQVKIMYGSNIDPTTRVNANLGYDLMLQDANYAPSTLNGNVTLPTTPPVPNLSGAVGDAFGNVALSATPYPKTDIHASYSIDNRDNMTSINKYTTVEDDSNLAIAGQIANINAPQSETNQNVKADVGYRVLNSTKITLGVGYGQIDRTYAQVDRNNETTFSAKANSNLAEGVNARLSLQHSIRTMGTLNLNGPWVAQGYAANEGNQLMFYDAPRAQDMISAYVTAMPSDEVTLGFMGKFANDHYFATNIYGNVQTAAGSAGSNFGRTNDQTLTLGPDVSYQPRKDLDFHFFYNYELVYDGITGPGANSTSPYFADWSEKTTNSVHTAGLSQTWQAIPDKFKVTLSYNFSYGDSAYVLGDGVIGLAGGQNPVTSTGQNYIITSLPHNTSQLHDLSLHGEYQMTPTMSLWLGYSFERFMYSDPTFGYSATQYGNALLPGDSSLSYSMHVVSAFIRCKW